MATKLKDQRRADLIVPYTRPAAKEEGPDISTTFATALPMAAMFTRQKMVGWMAVVFALQSFLNEPSTSAVVDTEKPKQPAVFTLGMSGMALFVTYMPMFFPNSKLMPGTGTGTGTGTGPAQPVAPEAAA
ncbi:hypothetical protein EX30DRAFT_372938 [Ascodesmis nigricans]|uniref:Protein Asterix n=1 Tax=Ascodesmis nigricans TaxID=341454 RepID=A0A4S2MT33_9PEZI|nr:hypothetical protein EX30DRAFT_372938 [Ascodesmis nigricans]